MKLNNGVASLVGAGVVTIGLVATMLTLYGTNQARCAELEKDNKKIWGTLYQIDKKIDILIIAREQSDPDAIERAKKILQQIEGLHVVGDSVLHVNQ